MQGIVTDSQAIKGVELRFPAIAQRNSRTRYPPPTNFLPPPTLPQGIETLTGMEHHNRLAVRGQQLFGLQFPQNPPCHFSGTAD